MPLLAGTPLLAITVWWQLSQRDGWPTTAGPQNGSSLVAGVVQSPGPGDAGEIYLWMQPPATSTPRAYRFPSSLRLEQQVAQAAREARRGARVGVRADSVPARRGGKDKRSQTTTSAALRFYKLPPAAAEIKGRG